MELMGGWRDGGVEGSVWLALLGLNIVLLIVGWWMWRRYY
jgi:LPXTG-motif cell wall-anchored protein